jgi:hypothetical protein
MNNKEKFEEVWELLLPVLLLLLLLMSVGKPQGRCGNPTTLCLYTFLALALSFVFTPGFMFERKFLASLSQLLYLNRDTRVY